MAKKTVKKPAISSHAKAANKTVKRAEGFATELRAALDGGTISPEDAEAMLAEMASGGGAAAALAAYVEGVIGRKPRGRASAKKKRKKKA